MTYLELLLENDLLKAAIRKSNAVNLILATACAVLAAALFVTQYAGSFAQ